ncbi:unnamed protein product [Protopolystoma xenopodis]|uniref:Uncharacterized protein n=1 Tax=Protopolystoma xenopodis TaxID=117903 RepID=A0A448X330_9PLAT|nr:unnamed protein product [Protopolystoma xenopodis]
MTYVVAWPPGFLEPAHICDLSSSLLDQSALIEAYLMLVVPGALACSLFGHSESLQQSARTDDPDSLWCWQRRLISFWREERHFLRVRDP